MNPLRHYPQPEDDPPPIQRASGETIHGEERHLLRRQSDRAKEDTLTKLRREPLSINRIISLATLIVALNQAVNWWNSKNVKPAAFDELSTQVGELTKMMKDLKDQRVDERFQDDFRLYAICETLRMQNPQKYPRFCDSENIQRFAPSR